MSYRNNFFEFSNDDVGATLITNDDVIPTVPFIEEEKPDTISDVVHDEVIFELPEDFEGFTPVESTEGSTDNYTPVTTKTPKSNLHAIAEHLAEKYGFELEDGVIIESKEDFDSLLESKIIEAKLNSKWEEQIKNLSPEKKLMFELKDVFDDDVVLKRVAEDLTAFNSITDEDIESDVEEAKWILAKRYSLLGRTPEEIQTLIEQDEALEAVTTKAKKFKAELIDLYNKSIESTKVKKAQTIEAQKKKEAEDYENLVSSIDSLEKIGSFNLTKRHKDAMKEILTKTVHVDENKKTYNSFGYKQLKHKQEVEKLIAFYDAIGLFNIGKSGTAEPDLSKLTKLTETSIKKGLDTIINNSQSSTVGGSVDKLSLVDALASLSK